MKTILVYGDSNTWGSKAGAVLRYPRELRWTSILQEKLGVDEYKVVSNGLVGRHAGSFATPLLDGQLTYEVVYNANEPVDIVIIALGGNDLKNRYARLPSEVAKDVMWYEAKTKELAKNNGKKPIFIYILQPRFGGMDNIEHMSVKKRKAVNKILKKKVKNYVDVKFVGLSDDKLHFSPRGHRQMAKAVYKKIRGLSK